MSQSPALTEWLLLVPDETWAQIAAEIRAVFASSVSEPPTTPPTARQRAARLQISKHELHRAGDS